MAISITKPTVGGSEDTWGDTINTALDTIVDAANGTSGTIAPDLSALTINGTDVTATAAELNYMDGVTSNVQTQIDAKAPTASPSFTGSASFAGAVDVNAAFTANSLAIDNGSNDWTFEVSSNKLIIKYGGTAKMELDTSGNLKVTGDVTAFGTIS